jgi:hypothetical protein
MSLFNQVQLIGCSCFVFGHPQESHRPYVKVDVSATRFCLGVAPGTRVAFLKYATILFSISFSLLIKHKCPSVFQTLTFFYNFFSLGVKFRFLWFH